MDLWIDGTLTDRNLRIEKELPFVYFYKHALFCPSTGHSERPTIVHLNSGCQQENNTPALFVCMYVYILTSLGPHLEYDEIFRVGFH